MDLAKDRPVNPNGKDVLFVGHFSRVEKDGFLGGSVAGNEVQRQIVSELRRAESVSNVAVISMHPSPCWPRGPFLNRRRREDDVEFPGYVNLMFLKHLVFATVLISKLLHRRPDIVVQYNSYLFENLALWIFSKIIKTKIVIFIQDVFTSPDAVLLGRLWVRRQLEIASLALCRGFDLLVPISRAIVEDFRFDTNKCMLFQGAPTRVNVEAEDRRPLALGGYAVFAGGLEPHNGVGKLLENWLSQDIAATLHVFGRGSLSDYVAEMSRRSGGKILFHGFKSVDEVMHWQERASWNFCFRFSKGLDQRYFFPSKFFQIMAQSGAVLVNDFYGIPEGARPFVSIVRDDFADLKRVMLSSTQELRPGFVLDRWKHVRERYTWAAVVREVFRRIANPEAT